MSQVNISRGNTKMGAIRSVSLPSVITCKPCGCAKKCYARRIERRRANVSAAYKNNLQILQSDPNKYWREVEAAVVLSRYFRFHVSGDIPDMTYLRHMVDVSTRNSHCEILCFTKRYEMVNEFLSNGGKLPDNLHLIFSAWIGVPMENPYHLPEAHVRYRNGTTTASTKAKECGGNCTECAKTSEGCWTLKSGEQVVFNEH